WDSLKGGGIQYFTKKKGRVFLKKEPLKMENQNFRINDLIEIFNDYFYNRIIKCIKCNSVCRWKSKNKLLVYCTQKLCGKVQTIKTGSFLKNKKLSLNITLPIIYYWSIGLTNKQITKIVNVSKKMYQSF
ncbi:hypothetical protein H312_02459, partial [Anncaliia algerae PRA339]